LEPSQVEIREFGFETLYVLNSVDIIGFAVHREYKSSGS
jgi:hypothetical protein